jgi:hypothetical protein
MSTRRICSREAKTYPCFIPTRRWIEIFFKALRQKTLCIMTSQGLMPARNAGLSSIVSVEKHRANGYKTLPKKQTQCFSTKQNNKTTEQPVFYFILSPKQNSCTLHTLSSGNLPHSYDIVRIPCKQRLTVSWPAEGNAVWGDDFATCSDDVLGELVNHRLSFKILKNLRKPLVKKALSYHSS